MKKYIAAILMIVLMNFHVAECSDNIPSITFTTAAQEVHLYLIVNSATVLDWGDDEVSFVEESGEYAHNYEEAGLKEIKIYGNGVKTFICDNQQITKLDVTRASNLENLECQNNQIEELDLSKNTKLQTVDCSENLIAELDVRNSPQLFELNCTQESLEILKILEPDKKGIRLDYGEIVELADRKIEKHQNTKINSEDTPKDTALLTDITDSKYEEAVETLIEKNIISGYPDGTFRPEKTITRAELVTVVSKTNDIEILSNSDATFNDVSDHWGRDYIETMAKLGFVSGYGNGEFRPDNNVTYAEVAAMLLNSLGFKEEVGKMDIGWPNNYIEKGRELQLYENIEVTNPDDNMTRGEVAIFMYNALNSII